MGSIFKAYDIRGEYGTEVTEDVARMIGNAFATFIGRSPIVIGRDMRVSSPALAAAAEEGILTAGIDVIRVGEVSTPALYYATGALRAGGGMMVTASHNPGRYNGFKLCREEAKPVGSDSGLKEIEEQVEGGEMDRSARKAFAEDEEIQERYVRHVLSFGEIGPLRIVADTANGMVGRFLPAVLDGLPQVECTSLFLEPDGNFPNHEANPLVDANLADLREAVEARGAHLGVAFDGDGDRCAIIDETGTTVGGDLLTALLAPEFLREQPGAAIVYDLRSSKVVPEEIEAAGGVPVEERTGHSFMKARMRTLDSPFGGELSGHFYFRDNYFADSGLIAMMRILTLASRAARPFSEVIRPLRRFHSTGEINFRVEDQDAIMARVEEAFQGETITRLDGITVRLGDWWFNLRKSNTEPLLRLNVEGDTEGSMAGGLSRLKDLLGEPA